TFLDDTWLLLLISSFIGIIFVGIVITTWMLRCRLYRQPEELGQQPNDDASQCSGRSNKNSTLSTSTATSSVHTTTTSGSGCSGRHHFAATMPRLHEAVLAYPCPIATGFATHQNHNNNPQNLQQTQQDDPRLMWATLTPRGTTRHYLEEHTIESWVLWLNRALLNLRKYNEPPIPTPVLNRPRIEKAFDNTAFVDYEEPLPTRNEYYQLDNVHEPCDPIFSVQGLYGLAGRFGAGGTLQRPRLEISQRFILVKNAGSHIVKKEIFESHNCGDPTKDSVIDKDLKVVSQSQWNPEKSQQRCCNFHFFESSLLSSQFTISNIKVEFLNDLYLPERHSFDTSSSLDIFINLSIWKLI
ncbi:hypothetical protein QAD02_001748, partial [Eretmocerus hayati]